jgi:TolA-binding protein
MQPTAQASWFQWKWAAALAGVLVVGAAVGMREMRLAVPKQTLSVKHDLPGASGPTDSAKGSNEESRIDNLPINGRNYINFDTLSRDRTGDISPHTGTRNSPTGGRKTGLPSVGNGRVDTAQAQAQSTGTSTPQGPNQTQQQAEQNPLQPTPGIDASHTPLDAITAGIGNHLPSVPGENTNTVSDESARELFRLGLVQAPPYTFSGLASSTKGVKSGNSSGAHEEGLGAAMPTGQPGDSQPPAQGRTYFQNAMGAYVEKRYADAIPLLEADLELEPKAADTNYYLGICRLVQASPADAIAPLETVAGNDKSALARSAHFYLAKAYIQMGDLAKAETELQTAAAAPGRLGAEARALLKRLQALRAVQ